MSFNLPNPSLIGILLIVSTHSGPQLVYKYPYDMKTSTQLSSRATNLKSCNLNTAMSNKTKRTQKPGSFIQDNSLSLHTKNFDDFDFDDDELYEYKNSDEENDDDVANYSLNQPNNVQYEVSSREWDSKHLNFHLGTKLDLLSFLEEQDNRRKEIRNQKQTEEANNIDATTSEYSLKQNKHLYSLARGSIASQSATSKAVNSHSSSITDDIFELESSYLCEMLSPPKEMCNTRFEITLHDKVFIGLPIHKHSNGEWRSEKQTQYEDNSKPKNFCTNNNSNNLNINMFHVVFIMNPLIIESTHRVDEMYHHVVSKLSVALRYEQSKHDYVTKQVESILLMRESNSNDPVMTDRIQLCKVIKDCYSCVASSKIATLSINNRLRSFQIPIKTEFDTLPDTSVPFIPGSILSSSVNNLSNFGLIGETSRYDQDYSKINYGEDENTHDSVLYFAILLLDDSDKIIKELKAQSNSTLAKFIKLLRPTESLLSFSTRNTTFTLSQIKSFAYHLIYWRRGRVIQPLSIKASYVTSPMAPITMRLYDSISQFSQKFPTLPSLPHFLKLLSPQLKKPEPYAKIIPSKDHRESYLKALAWLARNGFIAEIQTFVWLKIPLKTKIQVEEDIENETSARKNRINLSSHDEVKNIKKTDNTSKLETEIFAKAEPSSGSVSDHKAANSLTNLKKTALVTIADEEATILLDPGRATTLERRWINTIIHEEQKLSPELTSMFYRLLKYMNGKNSVEALMLKENYSKSDFKKLFSALGDNIILVRHW